MKTGEAHLVSDYDSDSAAVLSWLAADPGVDQGCLGAIGFCIGGHLAFRAALRPEVKCTACVYPTGLQDGKVGQGIADSLQRASYIRGALLTIFGSLDPHVPSEARETILATLAALPDLRHRTLLYEANHTFMRDDGERWDPECADQAWAQLIQFLRQEIG